MNTRNTIFEYARLATEREQMFLIGLLLDEVDSEQLDVIAAELNLEVETELD
jgi:hypothetical protein